MPTRRFYKLSDAKRNRIRDAAFREFTRVPMEMVSINRIIQEAGISRGSYYTYFENKWDILMYLVEEETERLYCCAEQCLAQSNGNLWKMLELFLEEMIAFCREKDNGAFLKNVLSDSNQEKIHREFWNRCRRDGRFSRQTSLEDAIYRQCAGISVVQMEKEEFSVFLEMALILTGMEVRSYIDGESAQMIRSRFQMQMQILRCGISMPSGLESKTGEPAAQMAIV